MRESHIKHLVCCKCGSELLLKRDAHIKQNNSVIEEGVLSCKNCSKEYRIKRYIPRFVDSEDYTRGFGFQWTKHAKLQYDSYNGLTLTRDRFFRSTRFSSSMEGDLLLEAGSGGGRFTEIAAETGAFVVSFDFCNAVESNYSMNGARDNVLIVQADIYNMPFRKRYFDKIFCFGVLQHTPNVKKAFMSLPPLLKFGGKLVIDVYKKTFIATWLSTKYYARVFSRNMDPKRLYRIIQIYINFMWPLVLRLACIPRIGHGINNRLLVAEYSRYGFSGDILKEMAYLDTFDMLSPKYDRPQTISTVISWFQEAGLKETDISYGYNGIVGMGRV